ncbi:ribosomal oxygenase 2-like [Clavelina lepadiformis]|uniref:ribosomal oxygenase 2-like n=1 Tax=Clavelina lepadiformis TaxID=159417 RepID=UPI004040ED9F
MRNGDDTPLEPKGNIKKRKGTVNDNNDTKKRSSSSSPSLLTEIPAVKCPLNFSSAQSLLESLLGPACTLDEFFAQYWEKKILLIKAIERNTSDEPNKAQQFVEYFGQLFNLGILEEIIKSHHLEHNVDMNACHYVNGKRTNSQDKGLIKLKDVNLQFNKKKRTLQFHQPQRFCDEFWKMQELMEVYFGSLVGCNIYMTPCETQGLAPHYDDVEVFILQLEGSKRWKLYSPLKELPMDPSEDLDETAMKKVRLISELTLNPGDVLYFPRGTIHQAQAVGEGHSTHATISTYQSHTWANYFMSTMPFLADKWTENVLSLRKGLPIHYHSKVNRDLFKQKLKQALYAMADASTSEDVIYSTCDSITSDFFANRLPPFKFKDEPIGKVPSLDSSVRLTHPNHVRISKGKALYDEEDTLDEEDDLDETDDSSDECLAVFVYHSLSNDKLNHMVGESKNKPKGLRFDESCWDSLKRLRDSDGNYVSVKELDMPEFIGHDMLVALWSEGIIETKII